MRGTGNLTGVVAGVVAASPATKMSTATGHRSRLRRTLEGAAQGRGQELGSLTCLRLLHSWAVPLLTSPELDAGTPVKRTKERVSQACDPRVDHSRTGPI